MIKTNPSIIGCILHTKKKLAALMLSVLYLGIEPGMQCLLTLPLLHTFTKFPKLRFNFYSKISHFIAPLLPHYFYKCIWIYKIKTQFHY
jgi:hypothetical protein